MCKYTYIARTPDLTPPKGIPVPHAHEGVFLLNDQGPIPCVVLSGIKDANQFLDACKRLMEAGSHQLVTVSLKRPSHWEHICVPFRDFLERFAPRAF